MSKLFRFPNLAGNGGKSILKMIHAMITLQSHSLIGWDNSTDILTAKRSSGIMAVIVNSEKAELSFDMRIMNVSPREDFFLTATRGRDRLEGAPRGKPTGRKQ